MPGHPTVVIFPAQDGVPALPDFFLDPETYANKTLWKGLEKVVGWEDVDFEGTESREIFSSLYRLRGNKEETLRSFFDDHPGWSVQGSPEYVVVWRGRSLVRTDTIVDLCTEASEIYAALK